MNYVSEENMQEILDGIARKIGQGSSGAGLEDWKPSNEYKENDICVHEGQIYRAKVGFTSDTTFSVIQILEEYELQSGDTPIAYEKGTDIVINDIVSYNSNYYKALYDFTCGDTFGLCAFEQYTPQELTSTDIEELINAFNPSGGGVVAEQEVLYEGNIYETDLTGRYIYQISDITDYDFLVISFEVGQTAEDAIQPVLVEQKFIKDAKITDNVYRYEYAFEYILNMSNINISSFSGWLSFPDSTHILFAPRTVGENSDNLGICLKKIEGIKLISASVAPTPSSSENYSLEEQQIGTWIDGKPLYQITIVDTMPTVTTDGTRVVKHIDIDNLKIKYSVKLDGFFDNAVGGMSFINSITAPEPHLFEAQCVKSNNTNTNVDLLHLGSTASWANNRPVYITIQYTKTTDEGGGLNSNII